MSRSACLRSRWDPSAVELVNQLLARGESIESPFGIVDGRIDLRGITLREFIKGKTIESCDFTSALREWAGQIGMSTLVDCVFCDATIDTNLGTKFERCVFDAAQMKGVVLRGMFTDCSFRRANLTSALGDGVKFERCVFDGANLRKAQLTRCRFITCSFSDARFGSGSFASSSFVGGAPIEAQLGTTVTERCSLGGPPTE